MSAINKVTLSCDTEECVSRLDTEEPLAVGARRLGTSEGWSAYRREGQGLGDKCPSCNSGAGPVTQESKDDDEWQEAQMMALLEGTEDEDDEDLLGLLANSDYGNDEDLL